MDKFLWTRRLFLGSCVGSLNIPSEQCSVESQTTHVEQCSNSENTPSDKGLVYSPTTPFNVCKHCPTNSSITFRSKKSLELLISPNPTDSHSTSCQNTPTSAPTIPYKKGLQGSPITPYPQGTSISPCSVDLPPTTSTNDSQTPTYQKYTSLIKPSPMSTPKIPVPVQSPRVPPPLASLVAPGPKSAAVPRLGPVNSSTAPYQKIPSCPKPALCRGSPPTAPRSPTPQLPTVPQPPILQPPTAPPPKIVRTNFLADAWLKFRLLMWKNFLQQWRRSSQTAAEILLPLLTMTLVLLIRWQVAPTHRPMNSYPPLRAYSLYYSMQVLAGLDPGTLKIAYSPTSPILEEVLMSAMATLVAENKNLLSQNLDLRRRKPTFIRNQISRRYLPMIEAPLINDSPVIAFANSNELNGLYAKEKTTRTVLAAVEFDDRLSGATELPVNLSYSLRFPQRPRQNSFYKIGGRDWKTDLVFPNYELTGPRFPFSYEGGNDPGYVNEWFIALQHSISTELISRSTGQDIHSLFDVLVQRFPHPPYWEDNSMAVLKLLFPMFVMLSTSYSAINIVRAIVVEKELQLKESMKIMGLPTWLHWTAWFWKQFIFQVLIAILMTILLKVHWFTNDEGYDNYAVFTHTSWTILLFFLMLYLCCMIFFCFMLSAFFSKGSTAALFTGVIWFLTFMPAFLLSTDAQISILGQILVCLFINTAMAFGFQLILAHECSGGLQWGRFLSSPSTERSRFMFGHVVTMLVVNCVLFMLITLYLEQISPGPFGAPRPWYFPLQSEFWCPGRKKSGDYPFPNILPLPQQILLNLKGLNLKEVANKWKNKIGITKPNTERSELRPLHAFYVSIIHAYQSAVNVIRKNNIPDSGEDYKIVQEKDPEHLSIGIKIENLTKIFGHNTVVNHLNFNVYNDQITVLLGHNGAGKTTTISMLTGNLQPTSGKVNVVGYDMSTQAEIARSHIGLCPQHNVLFDELTVREHLKFFSRLKGLTGTELKADIEELIKKLELESKRDYPSSGLSGGQKRRLCVGIALSGRAKVVLLDEPTSGMDPASRRALWDLLQNEKKQRSMILTTHFMDEADILGDRVAIMAQGRLQCVGSPYFLKRHYGVGYTLVVVKGDNFDTERCTALINNYIPNTVVKEDRGSEVTYSLPNEYSHKFEDMLNNLEQNANTIKFTNYGLLTTTLEDVFMSVGADLAPVKTEETGEKRHAKEVTTDEKETNEITSALEQFNSPKSSKTGHALLMQRMLAVWLKLSLVWRRSWWLVILQFVIPTLLLTAALGLLRYILSLVPTIKKRKLALTTGFEQTETLLGCNSNSTVGVLAAESYQEMFENANVHRMSVTPIGEAPMEEYYLNRTRDPIVLGALRYRILIGSSFSDNSVTAWFSNFGYHDVAVSLAAVHSALLKTYNPDAELTVYNHPLKATYADQTDMQMMISLISMQLSTGIGSSVAITTAVYIMFYIKERVSGAKLLQRSAGIHPAVMWGSAAIYDWIWLLIFCLPIPIACAVFEVPGLCTAEELARLWVCIMLYGAAILPLTYLLSLVFNGPALGFVCYFFLNVVLGMLGAQVVESLLSPTVETTAVADAMDAVLQFHPLYCLVTSVRYLNQIGLHRQRCFQMCDFYKIVYDEFVCDIRALCEIDEGCCLPKKPNLTWALPGVLRYLTVMFITGILLWILLMVIEYGLLKQLFVREKKLPPIDKNTIDEDVAAEANHTHKVYKSSLHDQALLALKLSKYYGKYLAVNQISFCVNDGECFGLLGVNGAGKTTTFKMLMGDESISSGEAFVSGYSVRNKLHKVHENIGYCPQFDALFMELTGRETLRVFALMRGLRMQYLEPITESFASALGFRRHLDKKVGQYSGGTRRKLNTAVAFLGKTRLIFVDEPTTGVDPAAKRHVWRAVRGVQRAGRGVVLTSHSMEECEALCSRLTIMVNGRFQCLGTPQHLKNKFSEGFTLTIKLKTDENNKPGLDPAARVKDFVNLNFKDPKIMEEYQGLLTYYLPDRTIAWSRMFGIMERAKQELEIEDYTIAQTTLEQIFLQFTKYQGHEQEPKTGEKQSEPIQKPADTSQKLPDFTKREPNLPKTRDTT